MSSLQLSNRPAATFSPTSSGFGMGAVAQPQFVTNQGSSGGLRDGLSLSHESEESPYSAAGSFLQNLNSSFGGGSQASDTQSPQKALDTSGSPAGETSQAPKVAICPECGSANCACLARITLQKKIDEGHDVPEHMYTQAVSAI